METKELKVQIPEGYEIDKENSTFECIKFKKKCKVNTWKDLKMISGFYIKAASEICDVPVISTEDYNRNVFTSKKHAESALAMAQISQLMPYYGGEITNKEWANEDWKYSVIVIGNEICITNTCKTRYPITFHTTEARCRFLSFPENVQLVKDLYMVD